MTRQEIVEIEDKVLELKSLLWKAPKQKEYLFQDRDYIGTLHANVGAILAQLRALQAQLAKHLDRMPV